MNYQNITSERQFKSCIGHSFSNFANLYKDYEDCFIEKYGQSYEEYVEENVTEPPKFKTLKETLFFVLFQLKNDLVFDSLGAIFHMDGSTAHINFKKFTGLLELALEKKKSIQKENLKQ